MRAAWSLILVTVLMGGCETVAGDAGSEPPLFDEDDEDDEGDDDVCEPIVTEFPVAQDGPTGLSGVEALEALGTEFDATLLYYQRPATDLHAELRPGMLATFLDYDLEQGCYKPDVLEVSVRVDLWTADRFLDLVAVPGTMVVTETGDRAGLEGTLWVELDLDDFKGNYEQQIHDHGWTWWDENYLQIEAWFERGEVSGEIVEYAVDLGVYHGLDGDDVDWKEVAYWDGPPEEEDPSIRDHPGR